MEFRPKRYGKQRYWQCMRCLCLCKPNHCFKCSKALRAFPGVVEPRQLA